MEILKLYPRGFAANTYLLTADGKTAVAIDPAQPRALEETQKHGLAVSFVLLTHGHFDHVGGCAALQAAGAKIGCLAGEEDLALRHDLGMEMAGRRTPPFRIDFTVRDGETLTLAGIPFTVIATPGHTAGSCCYLTAEALFTGDTLFAGDVGRCDLPTGSAAALARSLEKLSRLPFGGRICTGHGEDSTLREELGTRPGR